MSVVPSGVKPSQFYDSQHCEVADVQDQSEDAGMFEHGDCEPIPECSDRGDTTGNSGAMMIDDQVNHQDTDEVEIVDRSVADIVVDQQPVLRSKRDRRPSSKYDPAVYMI